MSSGPLQFVTALEMQVEPSPWGPHEWLSRPGLTDARELLLVRVRMPPGRAHQFHRHPAMEEIIYVLSGTAEQWVGRERRELSAMVYHLRGMYLDEADTRSRPDYARVDLRVALRALGLGFHLDLRNLTGSRYSTTGFFDPGGSGEAYLYPAAGRVLEASIRNAW